IASFVNNTRGELRVSSGPDAAAIEPEVARRIVRDSALPRDSALYELLSRDAALEATPMRYEKGDVLEAAVTEMSLTTLLSDDGGGGRGLLVTRARLAVQNRSEQYLVAALPAGASLLSVTVDGLPAKPVGSPDSPGSVLVPLRKTSPGETSFSVEILYEERT